MTKRDFQTNWAEWDRLARLPGTPSKGTAVAATVAAPKPPMTSLTHPLRVAYLPDWMLGMRGKLGITICPGRQSKGGAGVHARDLGADIARLRDHFGVDVLVSLMEGHEFTEQKVDGIWDACRANAVTSVWFPIKDLGTPRLDESVKVRMLVASIVRALRKGANVVVHCKGGLGRSGTLVACVLRAMGVLGPLAITLTRAARTHAIDTGIQERYVLDFAPMTKYLHHGAHLDRRAALDADAAKALKQAYADAGKATFGESKGYVYQATAQAHAAEKAPGVAAPAPLPAKPAPAPEYQAPSTPRPGILLLS